MVGYDPPGKAPGARARRLHILRVGIEDLKSEHVIAPGGFRYWYPAPDLTRAFATSPGEDGGSVVHYVDLRTGRTQPMGGGELPVWSADGQRAFRVINRAPNEPWLAVFDTATATETPLLKIPKDSHLVDISPQGRFVLLRRGGLMALRPLAIVDVASGKRHILSTPGSTSICMIFMDFHWKYRVMGGSFWSPDGRRFVVQSFRIGGKGPALRTLLYTVPADWP